jgi:hypothetical protein
MAAGMVPIVSMIPATIKAPPLTIHAAIHMGAATVQMTPGPLAPAIHAGIDPVATAVEAPFYPVTLAVQVLRGLVETSGLEPRGMPVQAPVDGLAPIVHTPVDAVAAAVHALLQAVAAVAEMALYPVTTLVETMFHPVSEVRMRGQGCRQGQYGTRKQGPFRSVHGCISSIGRCCFARVTRDNGRRRQGLTGTARRRPAEGSCTAPARPVRLVIQARDRPNIW